MGLTTLAALIANGVGVGAALTATYGVIGAAAIRLGGSLLLNAAATALMGQGGSAGQVDVRRNARFPTSRPNYRFPYGDLRVPCTPLPSPVAVTAGQSVFYMAYLVASRPTEGPFGLLFDNREVDADGGDPFDFAGPGAAATNEPFVNHVQYWIGRGDQTAPPQVFLDECGYVEGGDDLRWRASDAGQGCTIVWVKIIAGDPGRFSERWVSGSFPQLDVEGRMSKVWDMRDPAQNANDPDTWAWSENHALCTLDAVRTNPFRPYDDAHLYLDLWRTCADVADESVPLKSGGSQSRYVVAGILEFDGTEIEDLIAPVVMAGAARLTRVGGRLGMVPGAWRTPSMTITESVSPMAFKPLLPNAGLVTEIRVNYSPRTRGGEPAELAPWTIPGAQEQDGGVPKVQTMDLSWVPVAQQAQRVRNIIGYKNRLQRTVELTETAAALKLIAGSVATLGLPEPYGSRWNRDYEVTTVHPFADPVGTQGDLALRVPLALRELSEDVFAWSPATDEEDVTDPPYDGTRDGVDEPGAISVQSGAEFDLDTGTGIVARFRFAFGPSESTGVTAYEWFWRLDGEVYQLGGTIDPATVGDDGKVFGFLPIASFAGLHDIRVRTIATGGRSDYREITGVSAGFALANVSAVAAPGRVEFTATTPANSIFDGVRIMRDTGAGFGGAVDVSGLMSFAAGSQVVAIAGDVDAIDVVTGGGFGNAADWDVDEFAIAGGVASHTVGAAGTVDQLAALPGATDYRVSFTVANRQGGSVRPMLYGDSDDALGASVYTDGRRHTTLTAPAGAVRLGFRCSGAFGGDIDNVSFVADTPDALPQGVANFWIVPVTKSGSDGPEVGPFNLDIP
ncbi:hypothetical protein [uncultured Tateyamaria sp.]|uniref:hypothetical protein n=1 Tax=uncultured Tateyamaria sp. TaxID=455651 RepID=UPI002638633B|nr:hypothetical protein [uncultured Tateyamaria sp.]